MTIQRYSVPNSSYASTRYTATVDGIAAGVFGVTRSSPFNAMGWTAGSSPEMSFFTFGANADAVVRVAPTSGIITSAVVYPKTLAVEVVVDDTGTFVDITVPQGSNLYVEFDGDMANPLMIFSDDLAAAVTDGVTEFSSGVTLLAASNETLYFPPGVHTIGKRFVCQENSTILIAGGAWLIGSFDLVGSNNVTITGHGVLSGEFATAESMTHTNAGFLSDLTNAMILGSNTDTLVQSYGGTLSGITIVNGPFYSVNAGISYANKAKVISPWWYNCDGLHLANDAGNVGVGGPRHSITDCFIYVGDDATGDPSSAGELTISGCLFVINVACAFVFSYTTTGGSVNAAGFTRAMNSTIVTRGYFIAGGPYPVATTHTMSVLKVWRDETEAHHAYSRTGIQLSNLYIEGGGPNALFSLENLQYPFGTFYDAAGNISALSISNVSMETAPSYKSRIWGRDFSNTPYNLRFSNITIGGVSLTRTNWDTYVSMNAFPNDITLDGQTIVAPHVTVVTGDPVFDPLAEIATIDPGEVVVEDPGTGDPLSNSYCTLDYATAYHASYGNPSAWSEAEAGDLSAALISATEAIDLRYADRWMGFQYTSEQALAWPRFGVFDRAGNVIEPTVIPDALKRACAVGALMIVEGNSLVPETRTTADIASESRTIGPMSTSKTYRGGKPADTQYPKLDRILIAAGLIDAGSSWGTTIV